MANPFEDERARYFILRNAEHQYSLWPAFLGVPKGWEVVFGEASRPDCMRYVETTWPDMRPKSLADEMGGNWSQYRRDRARGRI